MQHESKKNPFARTEDLEADRWQKIIGANGVDHCSLDTR